MKIALVTPYDYPYPGGVTEHIRHLDREFRARGHETRILAASSQAEENLDPHIINVSGDVTPIPFNGSVARMTLSPEVFERVGQVLDEEQFDVIHVHEPSMPLLSLTVLLHAPQQAVTVGTFRAYGQTNSVYEYARPLVEYLMASISRALPRPTSSRLRHTATGDRTFSSSGGWTSAITHPITRLG